MGKTNKFKVDPANVSKHASSSVTDPSEAKTPKERVEAELKLLQARKQLVSLDPQQGKIHRVGKKVTKKGSNSKKQKKLARALMVADKEEAKVGKQLEKLEKRKARKSVWE
ncbi:uncharacterized protein BYT42DRAFT_615228 [Radiomyces spectabilis]|uniref:uncharacterized protein n=1 Tax=Radiomyces spectabilis TaxID=64574 RepID=UPI00221F70F2|nr:uncharacterized protein BYT42DRAFT_615228 [Radiomyces spectabilis]KAI8376498.1 hypothetical protein BYT42DRAFT_615228 [Radiomyces spectabilis]